MKQTYMLTVMLLLVAGTGFAQAVPQQFELLPQIQLDEFQTKYFSGDSTNLQLEAKAAETSISFLQLILEEEKLMESIAGAPKPKQSMPIAQPAASIHYPMLAAEPDTAYHHHLLGKELE